MERLISQSFREALCLGRRELVAIVGGGGKTTLMYSLVRELAKSSLKVAAATTTKVLAPLESEPVELLLLTKRANRLENKQVSKPPLFGGKLLENNKVEGISPSHCDELFKDEFDFFIVEADGARNKPLKAPGEFEPVVPSATTLFIAVIGLKCLGKPLDEKTVFRPELVAKITGLKKGELINEETILALLLSEDGFSKGAPPEAKKVLLLNQADSPIEEATGKRIASKLLSTKNEWERVLVAQLNSSEQLKEISIR
jgi:probable selenium-dependent hydroxylase accessory protein YqeC